MTSTAPITVSIPIRPPTPSGGSFSRNGISVWSISTTPVSRVRSGATIALRILLSINHAVRYWTSNWNCICLADIPLE